MLHRLHQVVDVNELGSSLPSSGAPNDFASSARSIERLCLRAERSGPSGWEQVLPQISEHASRFPKDAQAWIYLARAKMALGSKREAYRSLQEALALDEEVYLGHSLSVLAAQGFLDQRSWPQVAKHAEAALNCRPGDPEALELLFQAQSSLEERAKAQETLRSLRQADPQRCMSLLLELAYSTQPPVERHRWLSEAYACARGGASRKLLHDLAEASLVIDRREEALAYFEQAFNHPEGPDIDTAKALAQMYVRKDRVTDALEVYRVALQSCPGSWSLIRGYGQLLLKEGRSSEAIGAISRGAKLAPPMEASALHSILAEMHQNLGQAGEALIAWEAAASLNPESLAAWRGLAAASKSDAPLQMRALKRLVRLEPSNAEWHAQLGALRLASDLDVVEAEADLERALKLDPCNGLALEQKSLLLEQAGKDAQAIGFLETAARQNLQSKEVLEVVAKARWRRGHFREAASWYQELERLDDGPMWPCRLGQAQLHLEAVKDARSSLQRAGERLQKAEKAMDPPNPPAEAEIRTWVGYGQLLQGDYEGALEKLSQAARVSSQASTHLFQALTLHLLGRDPSGALRTARLFEPRLVEVAHRSLPALPSRLQQEVETLLAGSGSVAQSGYPRQPAESGKAAEDDFKVGQKIEVYSKSGGRWFPAEIIQAEAETVKVRYYMVDEKQLSGTSVAYEKLLLRNSENLRRTAETKIEEVAEKGIDADSSKVRGVSPRTPRAETRPAVASFSKKEVQEEPQKLLLNSEDLKIDKVLGSGGFGAVYRGTYLGQEVAIKKLHLIDGQVSSEQVAEFKKEVMNLQALRHPRLVSFIGAALAVPSLMIVTEFMPNGSLYEALHQRKLKMEHNQRNKIATQVSEGVSFLHGRAPPFVHRDLKSMNVVMDFDLNAKLCDFGLTQSMEKTHISRRDNEGGSPRYMAPELFDSRGKITEKVDVWALGCLVVEVISSRLPHEECTSIQQVMTKTLVEKQLPFNDWRGVSSSVQRVAELCFMFPPESRTSAAHLLEALQRLR
ncbi:unnamed protein product [Durusdinium trenchii]|uniref:Protein kinase domain-containing protein n=2 Tax=Durusdinium trenchii TaxID=1381693 RepID=A0ABP0JQY0_9DINO